MGHQGDNVDAECLGERRRRTCLDVSFAISIVSLFAGLTVVAVFGVTMMMEMKKSTATPEDAARQRCKTQNSACLSTMTSRLDHDSTMKFTEETPVGSNFAFDPDQHSLAIRREGNYLVNVDLNVTCTSVCSAGLLSVQVAKNFTCDVKLPSNTKFMTYRCSTVTWLPKITFLTQVTVPREGLPNWKLDVAGSGVGLFFVD